MANKTEDRLLNAFTEASGAAKSGAQISGNNGPGPAESANEYGAEAFDPSLGNGAGQSYQGTSGSNGKSSGSGGGGTSLESVALSVFGGAFGLVPLIGGLIGLFDSKSTPQATFQKYQMPSSISFEAADTGGGLSNADYGQMGLPRVYDSSDSGASNAGSGESASQAESSAPAASTPSTTTGSTGGSSSSTPQINLNVQAMDAQSFMSYSGEIVKAVRDAMLNLSSINDVVSEL